MPVPDSGVARMRIAIVGAGISGLSCAEEFVAAGHEVVLFDKGRGPGGRMSTRRLATPLGPASFDHGAQYLTARDPEFIRQVHDWQARGVVAAWPSAAPDAWVGAPGMNSIIKAMAEGREIRWNTRVHRLQREGAGWSVQADELSADGFDMAVLATPAEQAQSLLQPIDVIMSAAAGSVRSKPCWTALFAFSHRIPAWTDIIRESGGIGWACRNSSKPGRTGPETWVVQASPVWSQNRLEDAGDEIARDLLADLSAALRMALPDPIATSTHRWRYAMSESLGQGSLLNTDASLGACGDWLLGPRIECAWQSGRRLARSVLRPDAGHRG